jgi:NRPS condensation-like uncharacterized protein
MNIKESFWIPLDNAAKIYPAIRNREHTTVIRLTVVLKERVAITNLFRAIESTEKRFPYYKVTLRKGFFWYYLEQVDHPVIIGRDEGNPCQAFDNVGKGGLLFRILVYKNQISVEFSHILSDGYGVLTYLKSLIIYYFRDKGLIPDNQLDNIYKVDADKEEIEDAYSRYFKENIPPVIRQPRSFHIPFPLKHRPRFDLLYAILSIDEMKQKAKEKGVSITDYLVSVYLLILQDIFFEYEDKGISFRHKIARIQVPINLRNIYPSKSMRNFSLFVMPEIDFRLGKYSFDEILKIVYHKMQLETDEKLISKIISRNVGGERNYFVRGIPIWIKSLILNLKFYTEGANQYSGVLTNMGKINLPESIQGKLDYFAVTPPPPNKKLKINCGVIGYGDKLVLSFGNITKTREFERRFLHFLTQQGAKVRIIQK